MQIDPSTTGLELEGARLAYSIRQVKPDERPRQWRYVGSLEQRFKQLGIGLQYASINLGYNGQTQRDYNLLTAYHFNYEGDNINILSTGIQIGVYQKLFLPEHYVPVAPNPLLPGQLMDVPPDITQEQQITLPNFGLGFSWQFRQGYDGEDGFEQELGLMISNLLQGDVSLDPATKLPLAVRQLIYSNSKLPLSSSLSLNTMLMYWNQGVLSATSLGFLLNYETNKRKNIQGGITSELGNNLLAYIAFQTSTFGIGAGYDLKNNSLAESNGYLNFQLSFKRNNNTRKKKAKTKRKRRKNLPAIPKKETIKYPSVRDLE